MQEIIFDSLEPIEIPIRIGKDRYILKEASGGDMVKYDNARQRARIIDPEGKFAGFNDNFGELEPLLVSLCLYTTENDGGKLLPKSRVTIETIKGWRGQIQQRLYKEASAICGVYDEETVESLDKQIASLQERRNRLAASKNGSQLKNSPAATPATSG